MFHDVLGILVLRYIFCQVQMSCNDLKVSDQHKKRFVSHCVGSHVSWDIFFSIFQIFWECTKSLKRTLETVVPHCWESCVLRYVFLSSSDFLLWSKSLNPTLETVTFHTVFSSPVSWDIFFLFISDFWQWIKILKPTLETVMLHVVLKVLCREIFFSVFQISGSEFKV